MTVGHAGKGVGRNGQGCATTLVFGGTSKNRKVDCSSPSHPTLSSGGGGQGVPTGSTAWYTRPGVLGCSDVSFALGAVVGPQARMSVLAPTRKTTCLGAA